MKFIRKGAAPFDHKMALAENVAAAISAAVGGMTATTTLMPLDTIKTRMQSRNDGKASIASTFNDLISEGGASGVPL